MDLETIIFLGIIVGVLLINGIKKIFIDAGNKSRTSFHYSKPPLYNFESTPSNKTDVQQNSQSDYSFECTQAQYLLEELNECENIINHTTNPKTFFGRLNFAFDILLELITYEKYGFFTDKPSDDYNKLLNSLEKEVNDFIDRSYESQILKVCELKTHQGRVNNLKKYFDTMFTAFDCANTFWSGSDIEFHYTGNLFTDGNKAYLSSLYEECKRTYDLDNGGNSNIDNLYKESTPKEEKPQLVFDTDKEKELLAEYKKHKDDVDSSGAYYAAMPLIDFYYKYRSLDDKYLNLCIEYCNICISLLPSSGMQKYLSDGIFIPAFKKLVVIYDKKKEYQKALEIIDEAVKYDREVEYYEKKRASILKKMNK